MIRESRTTRKDIVHSSGFNDLSRPSNSMRLPTFDCFSLAPLLLSIAPFFLSPVRHPFSATHFPGHCFRLIPPSGNFAASAFPLPRQTPWVPPITHPLALQADPLPSPCPNNIAHEQRPLQ